MGGEQVLHLDLEYNLSIVQVLCCDILLSCALYDIIYPPEVPGIQIYSLIEEASYQRGNNLYLSMSCEQVRKRNSI